MGKEKTGRWEGYDTKKEDNWEFKVMDDMHFKQFYRTFYEWFDDNEFQSMYGDEKIETYYDEKYNPDGTREYRIRWRCYHVLPNENIALKFVLNWLVLDCKDKEVVAGGKKMKIQHAEVEIKCNSYVMFKKNTMDKPLLKAFKDLFWDRWYRYMYETYKDEVKMKSKSIEEKLKALFAMKTYTDQGIQYHRVSGYKDPHTTKH